MDLLITPFLGDYELPQDSIEVTLENSHDLISILNKEIKKGRAYHIQIYKNEYDYLYVILDSKEANVYLKYENKERKITLAEDTYNSAKSIINIYAEKNGKDAVNKFISNIEKEKYEQWKQQYDTNLKKDKKSNLKPIALAFVVIAFIFLLGRLIWNDELRFIGRKTDTKKAIITKIGLMKVPRVERYYQRVTYEFIHNGEKYINYFTANKFTGMQYENDTILIKFELNNPNNSKYISN